MIWHPDWVLLRSPPKGHLNGDRGWPDDITKPRRNWENECFVDLMEEHKTSWMCIPSAFRGNGCEETNIRMNEERGVNQRYEKGPVPKRTKKTACCVAIHFFLLQSQKLNRENETMEVQKLEASRDFVSPPPFSIQRFSYHRRSGHCWLLITFYSHLFFDF